MARVKLPELVDDTEYEAAKLEELIDGALLCRATVHWWDEIPVPAEFHPMIGAPVWWHCTRCWTVKYWLLNRDGTYASSPQYVYQDEYKLAGKVSKAELRAEILRRRGLRWRNGRVVRR